MKWQQVIDLAAKMTKERNGVQYVGLTHGPFAGFVPDECPLSENVANMTDPETGEVIIQENPLLRKYFDLIAFQGSTTQIGKAIGLVKEKLRCFLLQGAYLDGIEDSSSLESIDMVPVPIWKGNQDQGPYHGLWSMIIANYSEHKEWHAPYLS
ncbi:hypothetical protein [Bacillus sp. FSL K6-3431]|uniref:hypothetical protein n=1 Tax=Bacillus sp. FSL K6-3431 TaxID=2921500 RepID=UPI0030FC0317